MARRAWAAVAAAALASGGPAAGQPAPAGPAVDDVLVFRTTGQPDRKVKVVSVSRAGDGDALADLQDLTTGAKYTLPVKALAGMPKAPAGGPPVDPPPAPVRATPPLPSQQPAPAAGTRPTLPPPSSYTRAAQPVSAPAAVSARPPAGANGWPAPAPPAGGRRFPTTIRTPPPPPGSAATFGAPPAGRPADPPPHPWNATPTPTRPAAAPVIPPPDPRPLAEATSAGHREPAPLPAPVPTRPADQPAPQPASARTEPPAPQPAPAGFWTTGLRPEPTPVGKAPPVPAPTGDPMADETGPDLKALFGAVRPTVRERAATALADGRYGSRAEIKAQLAKAATTDPAPAVQAHCIELLSRLGYHEAGYLDRLAGLAESADPGVKRAARAALVRLTPR